jgi:hypothetical protein
VGFWASLEPNDEKTDLSHVMALVFIYITFCSEKPSVPKDQQQQHYVHGLWGSKAHTSACQWQQFCLGFLVDSVC